MKLTERELGVIFLSLNLMESKLYDKPIKANRKAAKEVTKIKEKINLAWIRERKSNINKKR